MPKLLALTGTTVHTETIRETTKQKYNVKVLQSIKNLHIWTGRQAQ